VSYLDDPRPPGTDQGPPPAPRFYAAAGVQILVLLLMTLRGLLGLVGGTTVRLQTQPVDPRNLFRGDYVILNYQVSRVPRKAFTEPGDYPTYKGQKVYVGLEENPETGLWRIRSAGARHQGGVSLLGNVTWRGRDALTVEYGVESYFVEENTGREIENKARRGRLVVQVHVRPNGSAAIKDIER
jgi:uncharacterized membrane-anchored protein